MRVSGIKADAVLAVQLVTRHRAPKMALALGAAILLAASVDGASAVRIVALYGVVGSLAAIGAARVWAPGAAIEAARVAGAPLALQMVGRGLGLAAAAGPILAGAAALVLLPTEFAELPRLAVAATGIGLFVMGVEPWIGASGGAILGTVGAWVISLAGWWHAGLDSFSGWTDVRVPWLSGDGAGHVAVAVCWLVGTAGLMLAGVKTRLVHMRRSAA